MVSDWLGYMVLGLIMGLSEVLPVSATANESLLKMLLGLEDTSIWIGLMIRLACMIAIFVQCAPKMLRIYRQWRIARLPQRRRKRMTDPKVVGDGRLLFGAVLPMTAVTVLCRIYADRFQGLLPLTGLLVLTGIFVYIPQHFPGGNRDSKGMAALDSLLLGIAGGVGSLPGMSAMGSMLCVGLLRGCDREYILEMALMLSIPVLAVLIAMDLLALVIAGFAGISLELVLIGLLAAAAAFGGCYGAVAILRYLAVRVGFSGFSYYSWGIAMFSFILYLMT